MHPESPDICVGNREMTSGFMNLTKTSLASVAKNGYVPGVATGVV